MTTLLLILLVFLAYAGVFVLFIWPFLRAAGKDGDIHE